VRQALQDAGVQFDLTLIPEPRAGTLIAREAARGGYDAIVGAGGDGTLNEVLNGLIQAAGDGPTMPFGVFPIGTGNDFSDMSGLPRELVKAARVVAAGKTRQVDAGRVNDHYFQNNCAVAMEPVVTIENEKMTRLSGNIRYLVALVRALVQLEAFQMKIKWDGGGYEGPVYLLSVCNSPRTGGIFRMAPQAIMDDGLFDYVFAPEVSKPTVLVILVRLMMAKHLEHPAVSHGRTRQIHIESQPDTPIHADGEVISRGSRLVHYQILPGKITLLSL